MGDGWVMVLAKASVMVLARALAMVSVMVLSMVSVIAMAMVMAMVMARTGILNTGEEVIGPTGSAPLPLIAELL